MTDLELLKLFLHTHCKPLSISGGCLKYTYYFNESCFDYLICLYNDTITIVRRGLYTQLPKMQFKLSEFKLSLFDDYLRSDKIAYDKIDAD
jgi:hypothetical protein